jgi:beta-galactosidase
MKPSLIRAFDKLGMLLWAETRIFGADSLALSTLDAMIQKNRNHPSITTWSLVNDAGLDNPEMTQMLQVMNANAKRMDPTRPTSFGREADGHANKTGFALVTDIMGYNGSGMGIVDRDHALYPNRKMLISEYSSGRGVRGNYRSRKFGKTKKVTLNDGTVVTRGGYWPSEYDLAKSQERWWKYIAKRHYLAGGIMWSGIEYLGESPGWPVVTSEFGVLDVARFKKDAYYYYQQQWTKKPMVHIMPDNWNWNKRDSTIKVWVYSNSQKVELFLNGKSLGIKKKVPFSHIEWKVPYQPGILKALGYNAYGSVIAKTEVKTAGKPYQLNLRVDRKTIKASGDDLSFITVTVCDTAGTIVPHADNLIHVHVKGGKFLGLSSGYPMSHADPSSAKMKAFNGKLRIIVQSYEVRSNIKVKVRARRLEPDSIIIKAR